MTPTWRTAYCSCLFSGMLLAQSLTVGGDIPKPITLAKEDLAKLPRASVSWSEHGPAVNYEGVLLYEVLKAAGAPLDPGFTDGKILLADTADGQPLDAAHGPFRVVVAQDKKGARSIRMLEKITFVRLRK